MGRQLRDFVHDVARANVLALMADPPVTGDVQHRKRTALLQMAETLAGAFGPAAPRLIVTGEYRLGHVGHVLASSAPGRERLGFEARATFENGIQELARTPLRETALARVR